MLFLFSLLLVWQQCYGFYNYPSSSTSSQVRLTDLAGIDEAVSLITTAVLLPLKERGSMVAAGVPLPAPSGVLLYGPPGTGKTKLIQALAAGR
jgi:ATP-dependent 26S proteasome regulatory subunit